MDVGQKVNVFVYLYLVTYIIKGGFLGGSDSKESACNAGDPDLIPGSRIYPGEGNGHTLQYFCLENPQTENPWDRKASDMTEQLTLSLSCYRVYEKPQEKESQFKFLE